MRCGEMRHRIKILERKEPDSPVVNLEPEYAEIAKVWAKKEDKISEERWSAAAMNAVHKKQLIIYYRTGIDESQYVEIEGETLNVLAVAELGNGKQWLMLLVGEVRNIGI